MRYKEAGYVQRPLATIKMNIGDYKKLCALFKAKF